MVVFARVCVEGVLFIYPIATRNARHGHVLNVGDEKIINSVVLAEHGLFLPVPVVSTTPAIKKGSSLQGACCLCAVVCAPLRVCVHQHMYVHTTLHSCMSCMFSVYTQPNKMLKDNTTRYTRKRRKSNSQPDFHEPGHITACVTVYTFILKFNSKVLHKIEY